MGNGYWTKPGMVVADSNYGNCWPINPWLMRGGYVKKNHVAWRISDEKGVDGTNSCT